LEASAAEVAAAAATAAAAAVTEAASEPAAEAEAKQEEEAATAEPANEGTKWEIKDPKGVLRGTVMSSGEVLDADGKTVGWFDFEEVCLVCLHST
jgi:hypothetical protein